MPVSVSTISDIQNLWVRFVGRIACALALTVVAGCGSTMQKVGTEQLLLSEAVDTAIGQIDFSSLSGRRVYLDRSYLQTMQTNNLVDANYIVSALRQQMMAAKCLLQEDREKAEIIVEPRVGSLGTDGHDVVYGLPQSNALSAAASAVSRVPIPSIPELSVGRINANLGVAKIAVFAYDRETREPVWQSGNLRAESTSRNTWILGVGPIQRGTIYKGYSFAGSTIGGDRGDGDEDALANGPIALQQEFNFPQKKAEERVAQLLDATAGPVEATKDSTDADPDVQPAGAAEDTSPGEPIHNDGAGE